jgi:peptide/nickel transport system substrate-binding protein
MVKKLFLTLVFSFSAVVWSSSSFAADCSGAKAAGGAFPQQYELSEYEGLAGCSMKFSENPNIASINATIRGNGEVGSVNDRLPSEPLVIAPYDSIGTYGGTFKMLSNATEAGTSDLLSTRHVNFVRFSDDLQIIVPNIAKSYEWNDDFTQLTFVLRKGHKWSDGAAFTADDVKFWYDHLMMDSNIREKPYGYLLVGGERMTVDVVNAQTVVFNLPAPKPGLTAMFANSYCQGFAPKHHLGQFHPDINPGADALAQAAGYENGYDVLKAYYGNSCWTDTPSPLLATPNKVANLPSDVYPSLESFITIEDTTEGRKYAANPYFHMVDTAGNQLPYIDYQNERYINENEIRILKLVNGEVDYKAQSLNLESVPQLMDGSEGGAYAVQIQPGVGSAAFSLNLTHQDEAKRGLFRDLRFRQAMSVAINRDEINEVIHYGLGTPGQYIGFSPRPDFVDSKWVSHYAQYDPAMANSLLDQTGAVDTNGDGFRELPNGDPLIVNIDFATQGIGGGEVELVARYWNDVGVKTVFKEVTPDEYRSAQSSNNLDVGAWKKGMPSALIMGEGKLFVPPYEDYFAHTNAMLWAEYIDTNGTSGVKPPSYAMQMIKDIAAFQSAPLGSAENAALGEKLVASMTSNMLFIGTVAAPFPVYHRNALKNFTQFTTASYEYYRTYPYLPQQWYLSE